MKHASNENVIIGKYAGFGINSGTQNTLVGVSANTGSLNVATVALGFNANVNANSAVQIGEGSNNVPNSLQFRSINFLDDSGNAKFSSLDVSTGTLFANPSSVGVGTSSPTTKLDVNGAVRVGFQGIGCSPSIQGAMRYNTGNLEFCDGTSWRGLMPLPQAGFMDGFGGGDNSLRRSAPLTGALTGEYWVNGDWNTTGAITCQRCRIYVSGNVNIAYPITVSPEIVGPEGVTAAGGASGTNGSGLGAGLGGVTASAGGSGGTHAGSGGLGGATTATKATLPGGSPYFLESSLMAGSSGGSGWKSTASGPVGGGDGGGSFYLEAAGDIYINGNISADGGAGAAGGSTSGAGGGGGAGGTIDIRSLQGVTVTAGRSITANGGSGGAGFGGSGPCAGGGGGGGIISLKGQFVSVLGSTLANGGAPGSTNSCPSTATSGTPGYIDVSPGIMGPRRGF